MGEVMHEPQDFKDMEEEELWDMINDNRHAISLKVRPCLLIPYLRQARVLTDLDEDEILSCLKFTNRSMRTSHMLDLLRIQGRNGAVALLEGLMIHYPCLYTQITGRQPSTKPSHFSGLIKYSELTEYLVQAVTGMQKELQEAREEASQLRTRCSSMQGEVSRLRKEVEEQPRLRSDILRLRTSATEHQRDLIRLKDEKCDLYVRYAAAVEEKSVVNIRLRDLNLQVYQLQCELKKAQTETDFQRQRSMKNTSIDETLKLRDEINSLRQQLQQCEKIAPACHDIVAQDLKEAKDQHSELAEQLRGIHEENETLTREKDELLEEKECLTLQVQKLTLDCEMYEQKSTFFQNQVGELQAERDRAYLARDEAQAQISCSLAEKDVLRGQLVDLQQKIFTLKAMNKKEPDETLDTSLSWNSCGELSTESPPDTPNSRPKLRRMKAINPVSGSLESSRQESDDGFRSTRSSMVEPPCADSLCRRKMELGFEDHIQDLCDETFCIFNLESDSEAGCKGISCPNSPEITGMCRASAPPFLVRSRPQALRISGRALTISFQGEVLLSQLQVIGGNKTGVFVHHVTEGSPAYNAGISSGAQILEVKCQREQQALRMVLEDSTMEEALWALGQVNGPCNLSLKPKQDAYQNLLQQLKKGEVTSGDSFYVRVNMSLPGSSAGALSVTCNNILHITNSHHGNDGYWWASHVHSSKLMDLNSGTVPNYYRAQRQLIRAIEDMSFQHQATSRVVRKEKTVRIVSTARQGRNPLWVSVEEDNDKNTSTGDCNTSRSFVSLMPYKLVTPHHPPVCRPVLLLPTILGGIINKRLAELQGFQLCEPEILSVSEHALQMQKGEVLEECDPNTHRCYTMPGVEKVMKRGTHCVLPLGLDCVRRLHRADIFPIIIFIATTERSARRLKHKLRQNFVTEAQLLECSRSEEPLLDKLPCLYRTVPPDSWNDTTCLLEHLQSIIHEEQRKIVWVEPDLW
ncbi:caspase recruitment domain-containing protein 14 [Trichomycterus rosablanca]|uniref:caspase recruitment domain-containing protein 14 n=1 Tax=Trichomycterus rosablanca TaxID=2290929 RepID=UPI002F35BBF9